MYSETPREVTSDDYVRARFFLDQLKGYCREHTVSIQTFKRLKYMALNGKLREAENELQSIMR